MNDSFRLSCVRWTVFWPSKSRPFFFGPEKVSAGATKHLCCNTLNRIRKTKRTKTCQPRLRRTNCSKRLSVDPYWVSVADTLPLTRHYGNSSNPSLPLRSSLTNDNDNALCCCLILSTLVFLPTRLVPKSQHWSLA